jgi:hypothetical protein
LKPHMILLLLLPASEDSKHCKPMDIGRKGEGVRWGEHRLIQQCHPMHRTRRKHRHKHTNNNHDNNNHTNINAVPIIPHQHLTSSKASRLPASDRSWLLLTTSVCSGVKSCRGSINGITKPSYLLCIQVSEVDKHADLIWKGSRLVVDKRRLLRLTSAGGQRPKLIVEIGECRQL